MYIESNHWRPVFPLADIRSFCLQFVDTLNSAGILQEKLVRNIWERSIDSEGPLARCLNSVSPLVKMGAKVTAATVAGAAIIYYLPREVAVFALFSPCSSIVTAVQSYRAPNEQRNLETEYHRYVRASSAQVRIAPPGEAIV